MFPSLGLLRWSLTLISQWEDSAWALLPPQDLLLGHHSYPAMSPPLKPKWSPAKASEPHGVWACDGHIHVF